MKSDRYGLQRAAGLVLPIVTALVIGTHACFAQSAPGEGDLELAACRQGLE